MTDYTIRELQTKLPWTIRYSQDFRSSPMTHKDFAHTLHHVAKAAGKLHALAGDMDHDRALADDPALRGEYARYIADLVVCALRLSNTFPGGIVDLQTATQERIEGKNGVTLEAASRAQSADDQIQRALEKQRKLEENLAFSCVWGTTDGTVGKARVVLSQLELARAVINAASRYGDKYSDLHEALQAWADHVNGAEM